MWSYFKLTWWACFWFVLWIIFAPIRKGRDNCLTYALEKWDKEGGYLVIRWCRSNKVKWLRWPHFMWLDDKYQRFVEHAVPSKDEFELKYVPKPWFDPVVRKGDPKDRFIEN